MRIPSALAACALLALVASACTPAPAPKKQANWYKPDGTPADREAVRAAAKRCEPKISMASQPGLFKGSVAWGVAMLDCLRAEGYVLVYEDPKQIEAEPEGSEQR